MKQFKQLLLIDLKFTHGFGEKGRNQLLWMPDTDK